MAPNASALLGPLLALGSAALYGVNIVSTRLAAAEGVSGVTVVFYRSFVMLGLVAVAAGLWRSRLRVPREERGVLLILGLATTAIGAAYLSSVAFIPVTVAAVIFYTFP